MGDKSARVQIKERNAQQTQSSDTVLVRVWESRINMNCSQSPAQMQILTELSTKQGLHYPKYSLHTGSDK